MTHIERHILDTYLVFFERLNSVNKLELIERLKNSLQKNKGNNTSDFFESFGAFGSDKSAEEIIEEMRENRKFTRNEIHF